MVKSIFTDKDLQRIREAVQAAEHRTRGEIVPMVVPASGFYREAGHRAGLALAFLVLTVLITADLHWQFWWWNRHPAGWILLITGLSYLAGQWAGAFPSWVRLFASDQRMAMKVQRRAEQAFYQHGLHKTREGTGVLIMISLLERRVQILADRTINERVPPGTWDEMVRILTQGIKEGRAAEALCHAIASCGTLLATHFPAHPGDNPDELADNLIQEP
jgi:putative membrane protein